MADIAISSDAEAELRHAFNQVDDATDDFYFYQKEAQKYSDVRNKKMGELWSLLNAIHGDSETRPQFVVVGPTLFEIAWEHRGGGGFRVRNVTRVTPECVLVIPSS